MIAVAIVSQSLTRERDYLEVDVTAFGDAAPKLMRGFASTVLRADVELLACDVTEAMRYTPEVTISMADTRLLGYPVVAPRHVEVRRSAGDGAQ